MITGFSGINEKRKMHLKKRNMKESRNETINLCKDGNSVILKDNFH
jgi:hypothetical protein